MPVPHQLAGAVLGRLGRRLGAADLYYDGIRLLRYGRGCDNTRLKRDVGFEPAFDAEAAVRDFVAKSSASRRLFPSPHPGAMRSGAGGPVRGQRRRRAADAAAGGRGGRDERHPRGGLELAGAAEFISRMRSGLEDGLDPMGAAEGAAGALPRALREPFARMARRLAGDYHEDEWGFDEEFAEAAYPLFEFLYDVWWRVQVDGVTNVPSHGRGLIVSNHSGSVFPFDATMIGIAIMKEHPLPRWTRPLVLNWAFELPFLSFFMRKVGGVPASPFNAIRLLEQDKLVMVFPEGVKGTGKPFSERYRLQRFGRGGFVEVALRTGAPIIPVAVVGAEEIYPKIGESAGAGEDRRGAVRADHPDLPLARAARPGAAALDAGGSSSASRSTSPATARRRPRTRRCSSTSPSRSARRSRSASTRASSSGGRRSSEPRRRRCPGDRRWGRDAGNR